MNIKFESASVMAMIGLKKLSPITF